MGADYCEERDFKFCTLLFALLFANTCIITIYISILIKYFTFLTFNDNDSVVVPSL